MKEDLPSLKATSASSIVKANDRCITLLADDEPFCTACDIANAFCSKALFISPHGSRKERLRITD